MTNDNFIQDVQNNFWKKIHFHKFFKNKLFVKMIGKSTKNTFVFSVVFPVFFS